MLDGVDNSRTLLAQQFGYDPGRPETPAERPPGTVSQWTDFHFLATTYMFCDALLLYARQAHDAAVLRGEDRWQAVARTIAHGLECFPIVLAAPVLRTPGLPEDLGMVAHVALVGWLRTRLSLSNPRLWEAIAADTDGSSDRPPTHAERERRILEALGAEALPALADRPADEPLVRRGPPPRRRQGYYRDLPARAIAGVERARTDSQKVRQRILRQRRKALAAIDRRVTEQLLSEAEAIEARERIQADTKDRLRSLHQPASAITDERANPAEPLSGPPLDPTAPTAALEIRDAFERADRPAVAATAMALLEKRHAARQALSPSQRQILLLRLEGLGNPEIAARTGHTPIAVRVHLSAARRRWPGLHDVLAALAPRRRRA
jgi:DNA-binding CsgD family transcriptional regulator